MVGKDFAQQRDRAHVGLLGDAMVQETRAAQIPHQAPADGVGIVAMRMAEVVLRPGFGLGRELRVPRLEERPAIVKEAVHQSPSKTGFCFAAKASYARRKSWFCMSIAWAWASISIA